MSMGLPPSQPATSQAPPPGMHSIQHPTGLPPTSIPQQGTPQQPPQVTGPIANPPPGLNMPMNLPGIPPTVPPNQNMPNTGPLPPHTVLSAPNISLTSQNVQPVLQTPSHPTLASQPLPGTMNQQFQPIMPQGNVQPSAENSNQPVAELISFD